ncbi:hypothetical protein E2C01_084807 [Portunus trituberculatus]|uniref:Uncharacterized protein n=1 Tax=Portunus trituberculatus TaxID=210409 RepID=A0A5B7J777_PORTR|nr:hypothetical protein [Portunus trituberculatus]
MRLGHVTWSAQKSEASLHQRPVEGTRQGGELPSRGPSWCRGYPCWKILKFLIVTGPGFGDAVCFLAYVPECWTGDSWIDTRLAKTWEASPVRLQRHNETRPFNSSGSIFSINYQDYGS